jgi:hypothetical protein
MEPLKNSSTFKIFFIFSLIIISFVLAVPQVRAAQSLSDVTKDIASTLYLKATNGSGQEEKFDAVDVENSKDKVLSPTREVHISLHDHLKAFFSLGMIPSGINNLYEKQHDTIYRAMFGIHIAL